MITNVGFHIHIKSRSSLKIIGRKEIQLVNLSLRFANINFLQYKMCENVRSGSKVYYNASLLKDCSDVSIISVIKVEKQFIERSIEGDGGEIRMYEHKKDLHRRMLVDKPLSDDCLSPPLKDRTIRLTELPLHMVQLLAAKANFFHKTLSGYYNEWFEIEDAV